MTTSGEHVREGIGGVERALQLVIDSGHADRAPKAAFNLGVLC